MIESPQEYLRTHGAALRNALTHLTKIADDTPEEGIETDRSYFVHELRALERVLDGLPQDQPVTPNELHKAFEAAKSVAPDVSKSELEKIVRAALGLPNITRNTALTRIVNQVSTWAEGSMTFSKETCARLINDLNCATFETEGATLVPFQGRVRAWVHECFGTDVAYDRRERAHRFVEEALELGQAMGVTVADVAALCDYVYARPAGQVPQEVGGVMVTLAALCAASMISMDAAAESELARISTPEMLERIRAKRATKPSAGPLPGQYPVLENE